MIPDCINNTFQYLGAIHIHTKFSDGTGDIDEISKAAKKAGLDWIIITDHNSFDIEEGFYNGVCVIKGEEISPKEGNHYLALGIDKCIKSFDPVDFVKQVKANNGFGFAAHPDEKLNRKNSYPALRWTDKNIIPDGIEIWNWFSQWADNLNNKNFFTLAYSFLFRNNQITEPNCDTLTWWDELNNKEDKIYPAIAGVDAHALKFNKYIIPITIFPYENMFKTISNVIVSKKVLSQDFSLFKEFILSSLKNSNNFIINRSISKDIPIISIDDEAIVCGKQYKLDKSLKLSIKTSKKVAIKVIRNGEEFYNAITKNLNLFLNQVGKYRIEIKLKNKGFVYTNPILVY